ncbi:MAG: hypothetical protein ABUL60_09235 [Myxococcales bacterium]
MPALDLEFATATRTGRLLEWLRTDAAKIRNGSPSAEWPHPSLAAFVLAHGQAFAAGDIGGSQRGVARSLAATHWRVHGPFQHREPCLNAQRCLFLDELERFVYAEGFVLDGRAGYLEPHAWLSLDGHVVDFTAAIPGEPARGSEPPQLIGSSEHRAYVGVRFRRDYVLRRTRETGRLAALIDDWERAFPLLRCPPADFREGEHGGRS